MLYARYMPPVGGAKKLLPELTDHCRPSGKKTYSEHAYTAVGPCRRCGAVEK